MSESHNQYRSLPKEANHAEIASLLRQAVRLMIKLPKTYNEIARDMTDRGFDITVDRLKAFVSRTELKTQHRDNQTVENIYNYFYVINDKPVEVRALILSNWTLFNAGVCEPNYAWYTRTFYILLCGWLGIERRDSLRAASKFDGQYVLLRKSIRDSKLIVKSDLTIRLEENRDFVEATHIHSDRHNVERASRGLAFVIGTSIHIFLQIEEGAGIELISLRDPVQRNFRKLMGFMISMDIDRKLLNARVGVVKNSAVWAALGPRFHIDELDPYPKIKSWITGLLDNDKAHTLSDLEEPDDLG